MNTELLQGVVEPISCWIHENSEGRNSCATNFPFRNIGIQPSTLLIWQISCINVDKITGDEDPLSMKSIRHYAAKWAQSYFSPLKSVCMSLPPASGVTNLLNSTVMASSSAYLAHCQVSYFW